MQPIYLSETQLISILKGSVPIRLTSMHVVERLGVTSDTKLFITRRLYNLLLIQGHLTCVLINKEYKKNGVIKTYKWVACPSIF